MVACTQARGLWTPACSAMPHCYVPLHSYTRTRTNSWHRPPSLFPTSRYFHALPFLLLRSPLPRWAAVAVLAGIEVRCAPCLLPSARQPLRLPHRGIPLAAR